MRVGLGLVLVVFLRSQLLREIKTSLNSCLKRHRLLQMASTVLCKGNIVGGGFFT